MISINKIQELLVVFFDANGYQRISTKSASPPNVLTEYWSLTSSEGVCFFVGFENWDAFEAVGLSLVTPSPHVENDWIETVLLNKNWKAQYIKFMREIAKIEIVHGQ